MAFLELPCGRREGAGSLRERGLGGGTVPHCKYTGRFGDLTAYWQEIVSDAVYLFRLGESEECDWLVLLGQPWSPYSPDGIR